jgi:hypothetical protein
LFTSSLRINGKNGILDGYHINEIDHFKKIILCSGDVAADVDHLYVREFISGFLLEYLQQ